LVAKMIELWRHQVAEEPVNILQQHSISRTENNTNQ